MKYSNVKKMKYNNSERPVDALAEKNINDSFTD